MRPRLVYDGKLIFLILAFLLPLSPLFIVLYQKGLPDLAFFLCASLCIVAILAERIYSLFFYHVAAASGGTLYSVLKNSRQHVLGSLLCLLDVGLCALAVLLSNSGWGIFLLVFGLLVFILLALLPLFKPGLLYLHRNFLQFGPWLYDIRWIESFDIRDGQLELVYHGQRRFLRVPCGDIESERLEALVKERRSELSSAS